MTSLFTHLVAAAALLLVSEASAQTPQQPDTSSPPPQAQPSDTSGPTQAQPSDASGQPQAQPSDTSGDSQKLSQAELDQIVAPIALYPDPLLANVMMASTYPLEVVEANRWVEANKSLKGKELKAAVDKQNWDDSVKQLAATPAVLAMMNDKLDWTQKLGDAVLAQQPDVIDSVQRLRARAQAENKLTTNKEQRVSTRTQGGRQNIVIEPSDPNMVYVPYYNPGVVYGAWPYPAYPPYYWPAPVGYYDPLAIAAGLAFAGFAIGAWDTPYYYWGGGFGWGDRNIFFRRTVNINNRNRDRWTHNAAHRHGVRYANRDVANRFNRANDTNRNAINRARGENAQPPRNSDRIADRSRQNNRASASNRSSGKTSVQKRSRASQQRVAQRSSARVRTAHVNRGSQMRTHSVSRGRASFGSSRGGGGGRAARGGGGGGGRRR
jgi:hypothetical protein